MTVRVRFAPSPTGFLHLGGARTALFNWLYARRHGGTFILRIEDTDVERNKQEAAEAILEGMAWLGMETDEGPFWQSDRGALYREKIQELLASGHAYKCYATKGELDQMREELQAKGLKPLYDRRWRDRTDHPEDTPFVIRFKMPIDGDRTLADAVKGDVTFAYKELDDWIIARSDGSPTYNFVVVVDDIDMRISHVIRGDDHLTNTFKQAPLYEAFGKPLPVFGHVPKVAGLSKRLGSPSVQRYRDELGFVREGVINYLSRLGWSYGDQEIFSTEELVAAFDLEGVSSSPGAFDIDKMTWVNEHWLRALDPADVAQRIAPRMGIKPDARLAAIVEILQPRSSTLVDMAAQAKMFYRDDIELDEKAAKKWLKVSTGPHFDELIPKLTALASWDRASIGAVFEAFCEAHELKLGKIAQPTRVAVTGGSVSPGLFETVELLGRDACLPRLAAARAWIAAREAAQ